MSMLAKTGFFNKSTDTGVPAEQIVTGIGFTPKALILFHSDQTVLGTYEDHYQRAIGFSVGAGAANNKCMVQRSEDAQGTSDTIRAQAAATIEGVNYTATTLAYSGIITSFDVDGFTISWTTNNAVAVKIGYIALGGDALTNAFVGTGTTHNAIGLESYTGVGFTPDCVLMTQSSNTSWSGINVGVTAMVTGWTTSSTGLNNCAFGGSLENAQNTIDTSSAIAVFHCVLRLGEGATGRISSALLSSFDVDGFTLVWDDADTSASAVFAYLALKGGNYEAHSFTTPEDTPASTSKTGLAFKPSVVLFASTDTVIASDETGVAGNKVCFGAADHTLNQAVTWAGSPDGVADSVDVRISEDNVCITQSDPNATATSSTLEYEASMTSMNSDGYTLNFTTVDDTPHSVVCLAIGPAPVAGGGVVDERRRISFSTLSTNMVSLSQFGSGTTINTT